MLKYWKSPQDAALLIGLIAFATILGAWIFQYFGYAPCELCLKERIPYYLGAPLAALVWSVGSGGFARVGLVALALLFVFSCGFGIYHVGVENHLWAGPTACTGNFQAATTIGGFMKQLQSVKVVRCDVVSLRIFGVSMAMWNALVSGVLAILAAHSARQS